jgi:hypothetical protein
MAPITLSRQALLLKYPACLHTMKYLCGYIARQLRFRIRLPKDHRNSERPFMLRTKVGKAALFCRPVSKQPCGSTRDHRLRPVIPEAVVLIYSALDEFRSKAAPKDTGVGPQRAARSRGLSEPLSLPSRRSTTHTSCPIARLASAVAAYTSPSALRRGHRGDRLRNGLWEDRETRPDSCP